MLRSDIPIALPLNDFTGYNAAAGIGTTGSAANKATFTVPFKCTVVRAGCVVTATPGGAGVVKFTKRPTAGSDTGISAGDVAEIHLGTTAAGKVLYDDAGAGIDLSPGQEVVVKVTTGSTSTGSIRPFLLVEYLPETGANLENLVETT